MNYLLLGKLPPDTISFFLSEILKRKRTMSEYQWIPFDKDLNAKFLEIFVNSDLEIQWDYRAGNNRPIQKAFYSDPGHGFRIHKDGLQCKSALNIALSCNDNDWVRWYDEDYINSLSPVTTVSRRYSSSRNINIPEYESVEFIEERKTSVGDVYLVNTDVYHSFKCGGPLPRIILQTKFEGFPDFDTVRKALEKRSFSNLIRADDK
jgi:hypothetical protein